MTLSWISEVPPSMVLPRDRSQSRVCWSSSAEKPSPSQPSACGPRIESSELLPPLVELRAVQLEEGRLRAGALAARRAVGGALHRELEAELVHRQLRDAVAEERVALVVLARAARQAVRLRRVGPAAARRRGGLPLPMTFAIIARSCPSSALATVHPAFTSPTTFDTGTRTSEKNVSQKGEAPLMRRMGRTVTPGVAMSSRRNVMPGLLLLGARIGPDQHEHPVGQVAVAGPDLLAVDHVVVAVDHRRCLQRREIGPGVGLGVSLAPADLPARDLREVLALERLAAELQERRADHGEAEADERRRQVEPRDLGLEHLGLVAREPAAAVLARPPRRRPPARGRELEPAARLGVPERDPPAAPDVRLGVAALAAQDGGYLAFEDAPHLGTKAIEVLAIELAHGGQASKCGGRGSPQLGPWGLLSW